MSIHPILPDMNRKNFSKNMLSSVLIFTSLGIFRANPPTNEDLENQKSKLKYLEKTCYHALRFTVGGVLYHLGMIIFVNVFTNTQITIFQILS